MNSQPPEQGPRRLVHVSRIPVRWGDMDIHSHVNNTVHFRYMEQTRIEWFDSVRERETEGHFGIVVASATCNYLRPIHYPVLLEVLMYAGVVGRSSFNFEYEIHPDGDRTTRYATGSTRMVWIDRRSGRSAPLPEHLRRHLGA